MAKKSKSITQRKLLDLIEKAEGDYDMLIWLLEEYFK